MKQEGKEKKLQKFKIQLANLKSEMGQPKRPPVSFGLFAKDQAKPGVKVTDTSKIIAEKWKSMSENQKEPYIKKSKELSAKYEEDLAEWKAKQSTEDVAKIEDIRQKIIATRNDIKGIVPKPKKRKKKVVAKKAKPETKKVAAVKKSTKKVPEKEPLKAKKAKK